jgi:hypothetical protein
MTLLHYSGSKMCLWNHHAPSTRWDEAIHSKTGGKPLRVDSLRDEPRMVFWGAWVLP